jgi:4-amino-4-deoxy-L-arabinose transferase-like glycosyltransferase
MAPRTAVFAVIAAMLALRLAAAALIPLTEDEAYYQLWSMRPAFGYLDHPPMIAWLIWLGRHIAGDGPLGVRLAPTLTTALLTWVTFDVARLFDLGEAVAARAAVWLNATLLIGLGGELAVPDAPATLFWMLALWCAGKARRGSGAWWLAAGLAAGLGCLSKYSVLFLAPGILLWLATTSEGRKTLRTPWPWLAVVVAGAVFAPNVAWNAAHHWLTFDKQFGRARAGGLALRWLPALLAGQYVLFNPLISPFAIRAAVRRIAWPLLAVSAPFAVYLLIHSLHDEVQGQWPTPLYPGLAICAAAAAEDIGASRLLASLRRLAPYVGFGLSAAAVAFILLPLDGVLPFRDPARALRDWPGFEQAMERERVALGAGWIGTGHYGVASQLAVSGAVKAPVTELRERERYSFETPAERADFRKPGLVITDSLKLSQADLQACFTSVRRLPDTARGHGQSYRLYAAFLVSGERADVEHAGCGPS